MLIDSIRMQMSEMIRKKTVVFTFFILLAFVLVNFFANMERNNNTQFISQMYDPIKMLTLSEWSVNGYFLMEYYPILVVIPTACSYLIDRDTGVRIYMQSKVGNSNYWYGKLISVFLTTFLVFTIPFLIEILLSCICFSLQSMGDPSNFEYYQTIENENQYFMSAVLLKSRLLYGILMTLLFGMVSGILAAFNFSLTSLRFFKYKIFTFFPIYILFYLVAIIERYANADYTMNYFFILRIFNTSERNNIVYLLFLVCLLCVSTGFIVIKAKKDNTL